jgi:amino acid transporter
VFLKGNWKTDVFVTNYIPLAIFPILYVCARFFYFKTGWIAPENMDFTTGLEEIEAATYDEPAPRNKAEAIWQWLVSSPPCLHLWITLMRLLRCDR